MFFVIAQSLIHGKKSTSSLVLGVVIGDLIAMTLAVIGLGALLTASAEVLSVLKWVGAAYLVYLGIKSWRTKTRLGKDATVSTEIVQSKLFKDAFLVTVMNPKSIVFFIAFFPSFINKESALLPQLSILMFSFLAISVIVITFYSMFAGHMQKKIQSPQSQSLFNKLCGSMMIGAGAFTALQN